MKVNTRRLRLLVVGLVILLTSPFLCAAQGKVLLIGEEHLEETAQWIKRRLARVSKLGKILFLSEVRMKPDEGVYYFYGASPSQLETRWGWVGLESPVAHGLLWTYSLALNYEDHLRLIGTDPSTATADEVQAFVYSQVYRFAFIHLRRNQLLLEAWARLGKSNSQYFFRPEREIFEFISSINRGRRRADWREFLWSFQDYKNLNKIGSDLYRVFAELMQERKLFEQINLTAPLLSPDRLKKMIAAGGERLTAAQKYRRFIYLDVRDEIFMKRILSAHCQGLLENKSVAALVGASHLEGIIKRWSKRLPNSPIEVMDLTSLTSEKAKEQFLMWLP